MEEYWINDPLILLRDYKNIDIDGNINNITRYLIYMSIIFLIFNSYKWLYISILLNIIINIIVYIYYEENNIKIKREKIKEYNNCRSSTINNPYMNKNIMETDNKHICYLENENDNKIRDNLIYNLYQDETDINGLKKLRLFVTIPERDFNKFIKLLENKNEGCKNNGKGCELFHDLRFNK
jgi:hypothetical protein